MHCGCLPHSDHMITFDFAISGLESKNENESLRGRYKVTNAPQDIDTN